MSSTPTGYSLIAAAYSDSIARAVLAAAALAGVDPKLIKAVPERGGYYVPDAVAAVYSPSLDPGPSFGGNEGDLLAQLRTSLAATSATLWKPSTAYAAGQAVVNPSGFVVTALTAFTSGASYDAANWVDQNPKFPSAAPATTVARPVAADLRDYVPSGFTGTDYGPYLQAMLDGLDGVQAVIPPGTWTFSTPLLFNKNQFLTSPSIGTATIDPNPTTLLFQGADGVDAISMKSTNLSRVALEYIRIDDGRVGATTGKMVKFSFVYNGVAIRHCAIFSKASADDAVYIGGASGQSSDCVDIDDLWVNAGRYGLSLARLDNTAMVRGLKGDSRTTDTVVMQALMSIDSIAGGNSATVVDAPKLETNSGAHLLRIGPSFFGAIDVRGPVMRGPSKGLGGDILHIETADTQAVILATALQSKAVDGTGQVAANLINDVGRGKTYGALPATASVGRMTEWKRSGSFAFYITAGTRTAEGQGKLASSVAEVSMSNTTTETTLATATIPANWASAGSMVKVRCTGTTNNIATSGTLTFKVRVGGVTVSQFAFASSTTSRTATPFDLDVDLTLRTVGSSASTAGGGKCLAGIGVTSGVALVAASTVPAGQPVNTTADLAVTVTAQWATADPGNVVNAEQLLVEMV